MSQYGNQNGMNDTCDVCENKMLESHLTWSQRLLECPRRGHWANGHKSMVHCPFVDHRLDSTTPGSENGDKCP